MNKKAIIINSASVAIGLAGRYILYKKGYVKNFWTSFPSIHKQR